jgi:hypothetical protein
MQNDLIAQIEILKIENAELKFQVKIATDRLRETVAKLDQIEQNIMSMPLDKFDLENILRGVQG